MTVEELLFKMNIDPSGLDKGLRQARVQLAGFKDESEKTFLHAGSAARGFHKLIETISERSPVMGNALRFALNPIVGLMAAASAGAAFLGEKLKEINAELDRQAAENLKPIGDAWLQQHELSRSVNEEIEKQNRWLREQKELHNDVLRAMKEQLSQAKAEHEIDQKRTLTKREHADLDVKSAQRAREIVQSSRDQLRKDLDSARTLEGKASSAFIEAPERETAIKGKDLVSGTKAALDNATTRLNALKVASAKSSPEETDQFRLLPNWQEIKDMASHLVGQEGLGEKLDKAQGEVKQLNKLYHEQVTDLEKANDRLKELAGKLDEAKQNVSRLDAAFSATSDALLETDKELRKAQFERQQAESLSRFAPTMQELSGGNGPFGQLARQIGAGKREITSRLASGDYAGAERARKAVEGYDVTEYVTPQQAKFDDYLSHVGDKTDLEKSSARRQSDFMTRGLVERTRHVEGLQDKMKGMDQLLQKLGNVFTGEAVRVVGSDAQ